MGASLRLRVIWFFEGNTRMLFNTFPFFVLLAITLTLFYLPAFQRWQTAILIVASFVFYAWEAPWLLLLLIGSVLFNTWLSYLTVLSERSRPVGVLAAGVTVNLLVIVFFKYGPLLATAFLSHTVSGHWLLTMPLPIGISFYTFEGISLLVDLFRCKERQQSVFTPRSWGRHLEHTCLFFAFFPHLISGPILKANDFYPQIGPKSFCDIPWNSVFRRCVLGFFLKVVIADNLKESTQILSFPQFLSYSSVTLLASLVGYSMQIFADFAGYSLVAIGVAELFGYRLPDNFRFPYISRSLSEFWRRWHISLSTWLRDYLYLPLGGNRKGGARTYVNLFLVMMLGGLWHGAAWSFAIWGLFHGAGLAIERRILDVAPNAFERIPATIRIAVVFAFVTLGWLLFKLTDFRYVLAYLHCLWTNAGKSFLGDKPLMPLFLFSLPVVAYHLVGGIEPAVEWTRRHESWLYGAMLAAIVITPGLPGAFIYFQF